MPTLADSHNSHDWVTTQIRIQHLRHWYIRRAGLLCRMIIDTFDGQEYDSTGHYPRSEINAIERMGYDATVLTSE